jgi:hypothetical protein
MGICPAYIMLKANERGAAFCLYGKRIGLKQNICFIQPCM